MIREMDTEECLRVLARVSVARLASARENQPYVVPVSLLYHEPSEGEPCLYGFTTPGQKVEWMRANPLVCVEVDEVAAYDQWVSVVAFGLYEELSETPRRDGEPPHAPQHPRLAAEASLCRGSTPEPPGDDGERSRAWEVLKTRPMWWEPGSEAWAARPHAGPDEPFSPIFYRVRIDRVTGHEATRNARDSVSHGVLTPPAGRRGWLRKALTRVLGGRSNEAGSTS
jgi:uncharacterized protein